MKKKQIHLKFIHFVFLKRSTKMSRFFFFLLAFLALSLATTIADDESSSSSEVDNHQYIVKDGIFPMTFNELMGSTCIIIVVGVG